MNGLPHVHLVPVRPEDETFVYRVYASTRMEEIAAFGWNAAQQEAFLRMQFTAQKRWYEMAYPDAEHNLIVRDQPDAAAIPVGRIMVQRVPKALRLVDIALLAEHRGCGIGSVLVGELISEARRANLPVELQVMKTNRAARLYERLGFMRTGEDDMYYQMRIHPG
jgi:ribosomal protein S18 acetylase RimI-like enzyme